MPAAITVVCPECEGKMKAPADAQGKRVRCKACSHIFVVQQGATTTTPRSAGPATGGAKPAKPSRTYADDEGDGKPYGVTTLDLTPRCPECAGEMGEDDIVCLTCGFNTMSRERKSTIKAEDLTDFDYFIWRLPGIACLGGIMTLIGWAVWWCVYIYPIAKEADQEWIGHNGIKLWMIILCLFGIWHCGFFAFKRLILHPTPPDKEKT
jgi:hypothetical protein